MLSDIGVTGIPDMAAINRKYICKILYLRLYMRMRWQRDSNGYPYIIGVQQHDETIVWVLSDIGAPGISDMAAINRKYICKIIYLRLYMR
jgi:hypothetical protein